MQQKMPGQIHSKHQNNMNRAKEINENGNKIKRQRSYLYFLNCSLDEQHKSILFLTFNPIHV